MRPRTCSICKGNLLFNFSHISSHIHRSNLNNLPMYPIPWWKINEKELYKILHMRRPLPVTRK